MTIDVSVGTVTVLHRLALAVECRELVTDDPVRTSVRVGREVARAVPPPASPQPSLTTDPSWPCLDLDRVGTSRYKLRYPRPVPLLPPRPGPWVDRGGLPEPVVLRIDDPLRRYVPRRFTVHPWSLAELDDAPGTPYVQVAARTLRVWLAPGAAAAVSPGTTVLRGRVAHGGTPVRWARVRATVQGQLSGHTHADDRGEFLLVVADPFQNPVKSDVTVSVTAQAPQHPAAPTPDRLADLVVEDFPQSTVPALDTPVLRGVAIPPGYVASTTPDLSVTAPIGSEYRLGDLDFVPQP